MPKQLTPQALQRALKIRLAEIPHDGRDFHFDRKTGELNSILQDLVQEQSFSVDLKIVPVGNTYSVQGRIAAKLPELCSRCGADIEEDVVRDVNEFLVEDEPEFRNAKSVHGNGAIDFLNEEVNCATYQHGVFDLGEFVHETLALAQPFYPACAQNSCPNIDEVKRKQDELERAFQAADSGAHPALQSLRDLKI